MISSTSNRHPLDDGHPLEALAADFVARCRRGERPGVEEYAASHPELAKAIRDIFPTIGLLEEVRAQQDIPPNIGGRSGRKKLTRLGDFRIVREIGRGGMGIVYEAVQESLRRRVAVKVLATQTPLDEKDRRRFLREARTAGRLHHTNIVPILGVGEQDEVDFYVMQYIDGIGLDAVLSRLRNADVSQPGVMRLSRYCHLSGPDPVPEEAPPGSVRSALPAIQAPTSDPAIGGTQSMRHLCRTYWQDIALVGLQVAEALEYAHGQGTLHRDIKPANLLLDVHATTWVADFGLAKGMEHEAVSRTGEILGTLLYMAPEQWRGMADARSDIYSLGVTLYELLTLRVPHQIQDRMKALGPSHREPAVVPPRKLSLSLPVDLETIVLTAIAEEPERRYQTAGAMAADLARFLEDRSISVRRTTLRERWSRWRRRNPAAAALSALAACLAGLVAVVLGVAYFQTRNALSRESTERRRAEKTLATSLETLENVFRHLVPEQISQTRALAISPAVEAADAAAKTQPVVSPETAALLEDLRTVYDQLASAGGTKLSLNMEAARAGRRLGDIYGRLGNFDRAETAYRQSLEKYQSLQPRDSNGEVRLEIARLHNDLGAVYDRQPNRQRAQGEHGLALAILQENSGGPSGADTQFELARTYYLLGRGPDRTANPGFPGRVPRPPSPAARRRPGHGPPPAEESSPSDPGFKDQPETMAEGFAESPTRTEDLSRAIALLDPLVKADPKNPGYRYLLAQCYREAMGPASGPLPDIDKAERLLRTLVNDYPHVADYRFELADTCAMLDVRELSPADFPHAEERLRAALEQSADLVDGHPYAADYISLHVHILHKLARVLRNRPPVGRERDMARMDEAGQLYQEAIRRQAALVKRFPENVAYRFWLAMIRESSADFLLERHQPAEACSVLETAVAELNKFQEGHPNLGSLGGEIHELYLRLGEARERTHDESGAEEARKNAGRFGPPPPDDFANGRRPPPQGRRPPPREPGRPPSDE